MLLLLVVEEAVTYSEEAVLVDLELQQVSL
jgi:hypothetical protein